MKDSKFNSSKFNSSCDCPFVIENGVNVDPRRLLSSGKASFEDGVVVLKYSIPEKYNDYTDKGIFVKMYRKSFDVYMKLGGVARLLMHYISVKLAKENEWIVEIDLDNVSKELNYSSKATVYKAVIELIENEVLARHNVKKHYWINPNYFFNGDRTFALKSDDPAYDRCRNYLKRGYENNLKKKAAEKSNKGMQPNEYFDYEKKA